MKNSPSISQLSVADLEAAEEEYLQKLNDMPADARENLSQTLPKLFRAECADAV